MKDMTQQQDAVQALAKHKELSSQVLKLEAKIASVESEEFNRRLNADNHIKNLKIRLQSLKDELEKLTGG